MIFSQEIKFKQLFFSNNNLMQDGTYTDGNSRSFFSRSSSSVVYLLKWTQMLELDYTAILPVLAKGSRTLLQSLCLLYKLMKVGKAEKALQGRSSVGASRAKCENWTSCSCSPGWSSFFLPLMTEIL